MQTQTKEIWNAKPEEEIRKEKRNMEFSCFFLPIPRSPIPQTKDHQHSNLIWIYRKK